MGLIFRSVISRDDGEPYPALGMTSALWLTVPVEEVLIRDLIATQNGIFFHGLEADTHVGGDHYPHVIVWNGDMYLEDGHHRAVRAFLSGHSVLEARVLRVQS